MVRREDIKAGATICQKATGTIRAVISVDRYHRVTWREGDVIGETMDGSLVDWANYVPRYMRNAEK